MQLLVPTQVRVGCDPEGSLVSLTISVARQHLIATLAKWPEATLELACCAASMHRLATYTTWLRSVVSPRISLSRFSIRMSTTFFSYLRVSPAVWGVIRTFGISQSGDEGAR